MLERYLPKFNKRKGKWVILDFQKSERPSLELLNKTRKEVFANGKIFIADLQGPLCFLQTISLSSWFAGPIGWCKQEPFPTSWRHPELWFSTYYFDHSVAVTRWCPMKDNFFSKSVHLANYLLSAFCSPSTLLGMAKWKVSAFVELSLVRRNSK